MFDKFVKSIPMSEIFLGYRVRKDTVLNTDTDSSGVRSDVFIYTYLSDILFLYLKDGDKYHDVKLKKSVSEVAVSELCSLHVDYANSHLNRSNYDTFYKNDLYGVFGVVNIEVLIKSIEAMDTLVVKPDFKYDATVGLTMLEAENFLKAINKFLGGGGDSIECVMIKKDELDEYPAPFATMDEFLQPFYGKTAIQVKEMLKIMKSGEGNGKSN